jgi:hypothetical protein
MPAKAGIQYAALFDIGLSRRGILDRPPEPVIGRRYAPTRWRTMTPNFNLRFCLPHPKTALPIRDIGGRARLVEFVVDRGEDEDLAHHPK